MNRQSIYFLLLIFMALSGCQESTECSKFIHEEYIHVEADSALANRAIAYRDTLIARFEDTSVEGLEHEAYHLLFFSTHGFGQSIKFEKRVDGYFLSKKCKTEGDWSPECVNYQMKILEEDWDKFEKMIYEFDFWTAKPFNEPRKYILDGYTYLLEGNRPDAGQCNKKVHRLIGRGSPEYDKIGALCDYIDDYEKRLATRYERRINR